MFIISSFGASEETEADATEEITEAVLPNAGLGGKEADATLERAGKAGTTSLFLGAFAGETTAFYCGIVVLDFVKGLPASGLAPFAAIPPVVFFFFAFFALLILYFL